MSPIRTTPNSRPRSVSTAWSLLLVALAVVFLSGASPALAQDSRAQEDPPSLAQGDGPVTLVLEGGQRALLRLAFPELGRGELPNAAARDAALELEATLRSDLERAGIFRIMTPLELQALELSGDLSRDMERYRSLGNELLLTGELVGEPGKIRFEGAIYDLGSRQLVLGKRYRGDFRVARRIAHTFADEIVSYFTGQPGIALTSIAFHSDRTGDKEIFVMDYDGENVRQVTGHRSVSLFPTWSPDGAGLAYVSYLGDSPGIYYADLASGRKRPLVTDGRLNSSPAYSADGRSLAFTRSLTGNAEIFRSGSDGSGVTQLTRSRALESSPAWSPTGAEIAFTSSRTGRPAIWVMDPEGTNLQRISSTGNYEDGATWSPDGTKIAYASRIRGVFQIVVTDRTTLQSQVITSGPGDKESPSYSPDGRHLVYTRSDATGSGKRTQVWIMNADGGDPLQLTREGNNFSPVWSPYPG